MPIRFKRRRTVRFKRRGSNVVRKRRRTVTKKVIKVPFPRRRPPPRSRWSRVVRGGAAIWRAFRTWTQPSEQLHSGISTYKKSIMLARPKRVFKNAATFTYLQQNSNSVTSNPGQQGVLDILLLFPASAFVNLTPPAPPFDYKTLGVNFYALNPNQTVTGGNALAPHPTAGVPANDYIHIRKVNVELNLWNYEAVPTEATVYLFKLKKYLPNVTSPPTGIPGPGPTYTFYDVLFNHHAAGFATATQALAGGGLALTPATVGSETVFTYGVSPLALKEFVQVWQPLFAKKFFFSGGSYQRIQLDIGIHKTFSLTALNETYGVSGNFQGIPGTTMGIMVISRGMPARNASAGFADATGENIAFCPAQTNIAWTATHKYYLCALPDNKRESYDIACPQFPQSTGTGIEKFLNIVDTAVNVANAIV